MDNSLVEPIIDVFRQIWRHRPELKVFGRTVWEDQTIPGTILDTIDNLGLETRSGLKPVIAHKHRTQAGWHIVLHLPPGISSHDIISKLPYFQEQCNATINVKVMGPKVHMDIHCTQLPNTVSFAWEPPESMDLPIPIGLSATGMVNVDLSRLPHLLVGGNTGGGKTTFLRGLTVAVLNQGARVVVIDLKGLDFAHLSDHVLLLDEQEAASKVLKRLNQELDRRRHILKKAKAEKVQEYDGKLPWIVVIIDELGELREKEDQDALSRLARLSRATGICLVAATQRPSHTLYNKFTDTRMLFSGRLCFHVPSGDDSRIILGTNTASKLSPDTPGRAIWSWNRELEVQCMYLTGKQAGKLVQRMPGVVFNEQCVKRLSPR